MNAFFLLPQLSLLLVRLSTAQASNPFTNLLKEYKGLEWQEDVIRFFDKVQLSLKSRGDAGAAYVELSWRVHEDLGKINK